EQVHYPPGRLERQLPNPGCPNSDCGADLSLPIPGATLSTVIARPVEGSLVPACPDAPAGARPAQSLKLAKKLLALPEPEIELALTYLIDALHDADLSVRAGAADVLAVFGQAAVPAFLEAWHGQDSDGRQRLIVTLGKIGPSAALAVPLLKSALADPLLAEPA